MKTLVPICAAMIALPMQSGRACTYMNSDSAGRYADIIFVGTPEKISPLAVGVLQAPTVNKKRDGSEIYFRITQVLKGAALVTATVTTDSIRGYCSGLRLIKTMDPSASGEYLIYAWKNKISGNYRTNNAIPNGRTLPQIDPRFPSGLWTLRSSSRRLSWYWLRMNGGQFRQKIRSHVTYYTGSILRQKFHATSRAW